MHFKDIYQEISSFRDFTYINSILSSKIINETTNSSYESYINYLKIIEPRK